MEQDETVMMQKMFDDLINELDKFNSQADNVNRQIEYFNNRFWSSNFKIGRRFYEVLSSLLASKFKVIEKTLDDCFGND